MNLLRLIAAFLTPDDGTLHFSRKFTTGEVHITTCWARYSNYKYKKCSTSHAVLGLLVPVLVIQRLSGRYDAKGFGSVTWHESIFLFAHVLWPTLKMDVPWKQPGDVSYHKLCWSVLFLRCIDLSTIVLRVIWNQFCAPEDTDKKRLRRTDPAHHSQYVTT